MQDPERLSRGTDELLTLLQMFQEIGVRVEFATGGDPLQTSALRRPAPR
jgi:hypothetical protein